MDFGPSKSLSIARLTEAPSFFVASEGCSIARFKEVPVFFAEFCGVKHWHISVFAPLASALLCLSPSLSFYKSSYVGMTNDHDMNIKCPVFHICLMAELFCVQIAFICFHPRATVVPNAPT